MTARQLPGISPGHARAVGDQVGSQQKVGTPQATKAGAQQNDCDAVHGLRPSKHAPNQRNCYRELYRNMVYGALD